MTGILRIPTLWLTERRLVRRIVTETPMGRRVVQRFVAGDTLEDGMSAAQRLAERGIAAMLDHLGENVESAAQAAAATDSYIRALKRIQEAPDLDCNISVKLTQLGLDVSFDLCAENIERVLQAAAGQDRTTLVMIDMEARPYVDRTLQIYLGLRDRYPNVGVCLQAYLRRTAADAQRIGGPRAIVRVAKGAYLESVDFAFRTRREVRRSFTTIAATLLASGSVVHIATHDPRLVEGTERFVRARSISNRRYEFQMLYGIRGDLQRSLVAEGEPVRVYVPYGTQWYPYLTRRLAERPANVWFFLSNLFARGG
ncbi:MAG TPA: proline dehydrogenase family protein [Actinomycetota bacterium]